MLSAWTPNDICEQILKLANKGITPSQIRMILQNSCDFRPVKDITVNKILRILKLNGLAPEVPEDLYHLIKKAIAIRKHLERNLSDKNSKFLLILIESKIHRLARFYKTTGQLSPDWK
ncbi:40S ribosomal protein S13-like protein [Gigaspora rosea]|uniref:40S ribosomal protein S13-like protein n=1 Tax=Gigaspora rosea TaxID=44941 RepID=A0A397TVV7_9GLOM|nr:40S ribosomal protein S13-like protein [Gigaspora rosea]